MQGQENVIGGPGWATCPQEKMILGVLEMSGTLQKPKMGNCYIQTSRDVGKTCQKPAENQNIPFSTHAHQGHRELFWWQRGEMEDTDWKYARSGKCPEMTKLSDISSGEKVF